MTRLQWDNTGEHFYETGTRNGVLYPQATDGTYPLGVAWNGLTGVTESPSGAEANDQYADDIKYISLRSAEQFAATIEAFTYPDEFAECDGSAEIASGVMLGQQGRKAFGFSYKTIVGNDVEGNEKGYKLHLIYGCKASPSEKAYQTINDSPEAITFSWEVDSTPVNVEGHKPTSQLTIDSTKVSAAVLSELEDILYGTANASPRLPLPAEVIAMVTAGTYDITINRGNITIAEGDTYALSATTSPAGETVTWAVTTGGTYASVNSSGVVTALGEGSAVVTASFTAEDTNTYSDTCRVTVEAAPETEG